ncbi:MAG TPA: serine hydrolase domain-containing protein [Magnetospirillaceae bacterium]|nr:serine hydrolase domain-containing protein [Magnetospirillaceae bacterium]
MIVSRRHCLQLATLATGGLALASASAAEKSAAPAGPYKEAVEALRRYVEKHLAAYSLPGITIALADGAGFSTSLTAGWSNVERKLPVTPAQYFQIGSISKSLASLALLKLVDEGRLSLDDDVRTHLPEIRVKDGKPFTIRHMLTHSTGLPADAPIGPRGGDGSFWQGFAPGTQFSYSNLAYQMIGMIVAKLRGKPYGEALAEDVLRPLGMGEAFPAIRPADREHYAQGYAPFYPDRAYARGNRLAAAHDFTFTEAAGCVAATPGIMAVYLKWLIDSAAGKGAALLKPETRKLFTRPAIEAAEFGQGAHYALGLAVLPLDDKPVLYHTGGMLAFSSSLMVDEAAGVGAFASVNARAEDSYRPRAVTAYAVRLMRAVREGKPLPAPQDIPSATKVDESKSLAGTYRSADGRSVELVPAGDGLALRAGGGLLPLQNGGEGNFIVAGPGDETSGLHLDIDKGKVRSVGWRSSLYTADGSAPAAVPEALKRCAGLYDGGNPWVGMMEVVARPDGLWLGGTTPLVALPDGSFRVGADAWGPERVRFDLEIDGRPQRMTLSGADMLRV